MVSSCFRVGGSVTIYSEGFVMVGESNGWCGEICLNGAQGVKPFNSKHNIGALDC